MGIIDAFCAEDRVSVKFSDFYNLIKESTRVEMMENGLRYRIPHAHILAITCGDIKTATDEESKEDQPL